jgi:arylsulfatase A-like enzyme
MQIMSVKSFSTKLAYIALPLSLTVPDYAVCQDKPNVIFIFADDLGWGDLSCYGNDRVKTPSLDKLASQGTIFTQFYVAASVCSPSRTGILTGQYPAKNRIFAHFASTEQNQRRDMPEALDPELYTLADMFKQSGYATAHFGKTHLGNLPPSSYGFDVYRADKFCNIENKEPFDLGSPDFQPYASEAILNEAIEFIDSTKGEPFFANIWFKDVHAVLNPTEELLQAVSHLQPRGNTRFTGLEQVYYAALVELDRQIGKFIDKLEDRNLKNNTLIIFSSDNGPEDYQILNSAHSGAGSAGPFRGRKRSIYEGGIRVPFIISWPETIPAGKVNNTSVVGGVDFIPTLASIVGARLPVAYNFDGEDMSDVWLGTDRKRTRSLFWEWRYDIYSHIIHKSPMIAIRDGDYKLLMNPDGSRIELYNIVKDPSELQNIVSQNNELTDRLAEKAMAWYTTLPSGFVHPKAGNNSWNWPGP